MRGLVIACIVGALNIKIKISWSRANYLSILQEKEGKSDRFSPMDIIRKFLPRKLMLLLIYGPMV